MAGAGPPKQYLQLAGRSVIEWALAPFLERADCEHIVVVLAQQDRHWPELTLARHHPKITTAIGGAERVDSVRAGLRALVSLANEDDWVLVHDAARPCLRATDLSRLIDELADDGVGGLLAAPVVDTLKRADASDRVQATVPRESLWRALTPQMFRYGVLDRALHAARDSTAAPTDEAQAVEALGLQPRLVRGDPDNIKITLPEDIERAARLLETWSAA
jgi:2-C-methyl-D-erythritol 4-phosphate cytidylyltransferase